MNLEDVIADSISDSQLAPEPDVDTPVEATPEAPVEAAPADRGAVPAEPVVEEPPASESAVASPAAAAPVTAEEDKFAKEHGLAQPQPGQRENRIPYSRVKAIVAKAEQKASQAALAPLQTKLTETEGKVTAYEQRLEQVGQFEKIMMEEPQKFLQMLGQIPAYNEIFSKLSSATSPSAPQTGQPGAPAQAPVDEAMPEPDQELSDGSKVYSMDGLKALMAWQTKQVETRVTQRYAPIETAWKAQEQLAAIVPQVQSQIAEARTWPLFQENEADIVKALQADQRLSLEGAYRKVVFPKLQSSQADVDKRVHAAEAAARTKALEDLKKAPVSTAAPTGGGRPTPIPVGSRGTEAAILDAIKSLPGRS